MEQQQLGVHPTVAGNIAATMIHGATGVFGNRTLSFQDTTCQWVEQLQPEKRTDGWGIGWLNMHQIEVMKIATANELQVSARLHRLEYFSVLNLPV